MDFAEYERPGINAYKEFAETVAALLKEAIVAEDGQLSVPARSGSSPIRCRRQF